MSVLPADVTSSLAQLLQGLQSPDNTIRSHAEESLNTDWVLARPEVLLMGLAEVTKDDADSTNRSFAAVLFRRIAGRTRKTPGSEDGEAEDLFWSMQDAQKQAIREVLLQCLSQETEGAVRNKVGDAVAEVARQYTISGGEIKALRKNEAVPWTRLIRSC